MLAGLGVSWYAWLEQGRDITVSGAVLEPVARALRFDEAERIHPYVVAGLNPPTRPAGNADKRATPRGAARVDAQPGARA